MKLFSSIGLATQKFTFFSILLFFTCSLTWGQVNLVMNPSLEEYSHCPDSWDEMKYADHWMSLDSSWSPPDWPHDPFGVPEYCNVCAGSYNPWCGIPRSDRYYCYAHSGLGMMSVQMFYDNGINNDLREYAQGHLSQLLDSGQSYCVTFFVSLAQASSYAIGHIGVYFDNGSIDTTVNYGLPQTEYAPQVFSTSVITDTSTWVRVNGSFVANGTERLLTIGNFFDNLHSDCVAVVDTTGFYLGGGGVSWYLIDDISVVKSDAVAYGGPDGVITGSDSVVIGDTMDSYLPVYWYANGALIDSNKAWLKVHPDTTTTYVVELDQCALGDGTRDTVVVWVPGSTATPLASYAAVRIYPNPATNNITIENAAGATVDMYDMMGSSVAHVKITGNKQLLDIDHLPPGVYTAVIGNADLPNNKVIKLVKE